MSEAPLKATLKAGRDFNAPWVTVYGDNPADLKFKLDALVAEGVFESVVNAANTLQAVNNVAPIAADVASPPQVEPVRVSPGGPSGWGQPAAPAPAPAPAAEPTWAAQPVAAPPQQQRSQFAGPPHPEGKTCDICPNVLELKKTSSGKSVYRCADWRWGNGNPNGHSSEWVN